MTELKNQLSRWNSPPLLKQNLLSPARDRALQISHLVRRDTKRIEGVRATVATLLGHGQEQTADGNGARASAANQPIAAIDKIRREFRAEAEPLIADLNVLAQGAAEMSRRHWNIQSVIRRATPGGLAQAMALRANYLELFEDAGSAELYSWAQQSLDDFDVVLMDSVIRANDRRKREDRVFSSNELLLMAGNLHEEFRLARAILNETILTAERAGIEFAKFENPNGAGSFARIMMGLKLMTEVDYSVDAAGDILLAATDIHLKNKDLGDRLKDRARTGGNAIERAKAGLANATAERARMIANGQEG